MTTLSDLKIEVGHDRLGRPVVVVDDDTAIRLHNLSLDGWREIPGVNYGSSAKVMDGTPEAALLQAILDAVVAFFEQHNCGTADERDLGIARRQSFYGSVVGRSDWDSERKTWVDYKAHRHLHVGGSIVRNQGGWRFQG